ncbi:MAG: oligosaccharide flippase family protein [Candidatus Sericytochromatia bacterium]|nr:oligosaccharide flippase family protein [Candidatus Sericytochromatia bacterium]
MNAMRRLASHGLVYGLAGMAASLASFVLTPLYARYLGPADYGQLETLLALVQITTITSALGAGSASLALIIQPAGEPPAVAGSALAVVAGASLFCLIGGCLVAPWLAPSLHVPVAWVRLVALAGCLTALGQIPPAIWRARGQAWLLAGYSLVQVLFVLAANVYLVAVLGYGAIGVLIGQIGAQALAVIAGYWAIRSALREGVHGQTVRTIASIGITHVANSLATWTVLLSDRFFLVWLAAGPALGCYTLGNKIGAVAQLALASPLALAWPSFLQQVGRDTTFSNQYGALVEALAAYAGGLFLFLALPAALWVHLLGGAAYAGTAPLVPMLAAASLIAAFQPVLMSGFALSMRFRVIPLIAFGSALLNVSLNLWWIPLYGATGAAWTTLAAYAVAAVAGRLVSQRLWPLTIAWPRITAIGAWCGIVAVCGWQIPSDLGRLAWLLIYPLGILTLFRHWHQVAVGEGAMAAVFGAEPD